MTENKDGDRGCEDNGVDGESEKTGPPTARAPKSVRDTLGKKDRQGPTRPRSGRGQRGRRGQRAPGARPPRAEDRDKMPEAASKPNRLVTTSRPFEAEGGQWTAHLVGSSQIGSGRGPRARLLNLRFEAPPGVDSPVQTAYVAAADLKELDEGVLVDLLDRLRRLRVDKRDRPRSRRSSRGRRPRRDP